MRFASGLQAIFFPKIAGRKPEVAERRHRTAHPLAVIAGRRLTAHHGTTARARLIESLIAGCGIKALGIKPSTSPPLFCIVMV
jgi:hypothetical protein